MIVLIFNVVILLVGSVEVRWRQGGVDISLVSISNCELIVSLKNDHRYIQLITTSC